MPSEVLRTFFRSGMFVAVVAFFLALASPKESAEFVISVCTLGIGVTLCVLVVLVNRYMR